MPELARRVLAKLEREREGDPLEIAIPYATLAQAYRRYWTLPESESMEVFQAAKAEIARLEAQAEPLTAWRTLRETATVFHAESGVCPFCRQPGELHLPAETPQLELRPLVIPPVALAA